MTAICDRRNRRGFLVAAGAGASVLVVGCAGARAKGAEARREGEGEGEEVSPAEDLMREHGILERVLLVYEEALGRLAKGGPPPWAAVGGAARIVRGFIEDYHEKLEEEHLFPRFEQAGKLVDLVGVLRAQHLAGRRLTDDIMRLVAEGSSQAQAADPMRQFIRLYRPHAAREDTVLFAELRSIIPDREYAELGEQFEEREHALFGSAGFRGVVDEVATLERELGIYELAQFTPA